MNTVEPGLKSSLADALAGVNPAPTIRKKRENPARDAVTELYCLICEKKKSGVPLRAIYEAFAPHFNESGLEVKFEKFSSWLRKHEDDEAKQGKPRVLFSRRPKVTPPVIENPPTEATPTPPPVEPVTEAEVEPDTNDAGSDDVMPGDVPPPDL